jgi:hypothetical protein
MHDAQFDVSHILLWSSRKIRSLCSDLLSSANPKKPSSQWYELRVQSLSFTSKPQVPWSFDTILIATRFKLNAGTTDPIWNQEFAFDIDNEVTEVVIKLFDKDDLRADDPLGTAV